MKIVSLTLAIALLACPLSPKFIFGAEEKKPPNVLFIVIDDLRPTLRCYGDPIAVTPNMDRLARQGTLFESAYCQLAVCSPSRLSLMTGLRPDTIRVWDLGTHFRDAIPDVVTLPQYFKNHGYYTQSIGKIYHGSGKPSQDPPSWTAAPTFDYVRDPEVRYALPKNLKGKGLKRSAFEAADVPDDKYIDGIVCNAAVETLGDLSQSSQPFFLAVGFRKPHLPFCAPKNYWDLYDPMSIPMPASQEYPTDAPELATRSWRELEGYSNIPKDMVLSDEMIRELRHGYYACVSYVDALVGRLLDTLQEHGIAGETVIVLCGDHGYHLGEQGLWTKANNYELSTRVPLIISAPKHKQNGNASKAFVELVDLYPTLTDICDLKVPEDLEGISCFPLLSSPDQSWKRAVFSQYPRSVSETRHRGHGDIMGYALRTSRYRYIQWQDWSTKRLLAVELYDHESDPNETKNVAMGSKYEKVREELAEILDRGWRGVLPASLKVER